MSKQVKPSGDVRHESSSDCSSFSTNCDSCHKSSCDCSSSSSSSSSKSSHSDKPKPPLVVLTPVQIQQLARDAVVEVHSEFILTTSNPTPTDAAVLTSETPLGEFTLGSSGSTVRGANRLSQVPNNGGRCYIRHDVIVEGNGFFTEGHYIITPAHLVLLPPSLTSAANRYPYFKSQDLSHCPRIQNEMIRASRILVSVFNVNGNKHSFVYEAELVGVDGAGDIAVLKINPCRVWNTSNPRIEPCHPWLKWCSSRASVPGEKVYLVGDTMADQGGVSFNGVAGIAEGLLASNRYADYSGTAFAELIRVTEVVSPMTSGLPILNSRGCVIGMQTGDNTSSDVLLEAIEQPSPPSLEAEGMRGPTVPRPIVVQTGLGGVFGPSQFFMKRIITALIRGSASKYKDCNLVVVCDPIGPYYRYMKGYLGLAYDVFTGVDYDYTVDYTSGLVPPGPGPHSGLPRIRLDANGRFMNTPSCKELIGLRVRGLAGLNPNCDDGVPKGLFFVPGGCNAPAPLVEDLPVSPFLCKIQPGDVITHINGCALGDIDSQIPLSLITWRLKKGSQIEVLYRKGGQVLNTENQLSDEGYENLKLDYFCIEDCLPAVLDYPWYAISKFPYIYDSIPPAAGQQVFPAYPARNGTRVIFLPAI